MVEERLGVVNSMMKTGKMCRHTPLDRQSSNDPTSRADMSR
jgi:hypothetical protein